jgi:tRNA (guanine-N1)-methyltransferase
VSAPGERAAAPDAAPWRASVLTLYPEMFPGPLGLSLSGEALARGAWTLEARNIRDFGRGRHRSVDDTPAGGGPGMVIRADVLAEALDAAAPPDDPRPRLLMSPRGRPLRQDFVRELVAGPGALIVCGRFEGVDERVIEGRGLIEVSIGDYVLSGGEIAAMVLLDAVVRLLPGVMGAHASGEEESFEGGLLEYPHYTRPRDWEGRTIPGRAAVWQPRRPSRAGAASGRAPLTRAPPAGPPAGRRREPLRHD